MNNYFKLSFRCLDVEVLSQVVGRLLKSIRFSFTILSETVFFKSKQPEKTFRFIKYLRRRSSI